MNHLEAIKTYLCPGCVKGSSPDSGCLEHGSSGCQNHCPGTSVSPVGYVCGLGLPRGFNRVGYMGDKSKSRVRIFENFEKASSGFGYDKFNVPVWAHVDEHGNTLVRVFQPRLAVSEIHVILENCIDRIKPVHVLTAEELEEMD